LIVEASACKPGKFFSDPKVGACFTLPKMNRVFDFITFHFRGSVSGAIQKPGVFAVEDDPVSAIAKAPAANCGGFA
jgi:hypothetical protein